MQKNEEKSGLLFAISTFMLWGVFPVYFKLLNELGYIQIVAHRIFWSVVILTLILKFSHKFCNVVRILKNKKIAFLLFITALLITSNWTIYIYGVEVGKIVDTSLGYFINPFFNMLLGMIILKERLDKIGKIATIIVFIAICIQIYDAGKLPFISLLLPTSFALYALIRKQISIPSLEGLFIETIFVLPFAILALFFITSAGKSHFELSWFGLLIAFSGPATVLPLLLFNEATKRLNLTTIGYLQYISPTMQLLIAVFIYGEFISELKFVSFSLIWIALLIVTLNSLKKEK